MTSKEVLSKAQKLLKLNQKDFGTYIGVSSRTINSWMTGERQCPDYVAEMAMRCAVMDAASIENAEIPSHMMRWAVIHSEGSDEWLEVCGSKADALRSAEYLWDHLTESEKQICERFEVGLIKVQIAMEKNTTFTWAEYADGSCDGTVYEVAKSYIK